MLLYKEGDICYGSNMPYEYMKYAYMTCMIEKCIENFRFQNGIVENGYILLWEQSGPLDHIILRERHLKLKTTIVDRSNWISFFKETGMDMKRYDLMKRKK